jgi:hypothetical protein
MARVAEEVATATSINSVSPSQVFSWLVSTHAMMPIL